MATSGKAIAGVRETRKGVTSYKTNERPGTRAEVRYVRVSAYKAREVLDLIRNKHVVDADEILQFVERDIAIVIRKGLASAVANAANNDEQDPETLFVSACYADEGPTLKRWRPRARGRATRIRKRTCHITIIVSRLGETELRLRSEADARSGRAGGGAAGRASRRARVAESRKAETHDHDHDHDDELVDEVGDGSTAVEELATDAALDTTDADVDVTSDDAAPAGDIKGNRDSMKYHVPGSQWYEQTDTEEWFATTEDAEAAGYEPAGGPAKQQLEGHDIKGNRDSMKYHVPGSQWYEQTDAEEWFATTEDAEAAGYEPAGGADKQDVDADEKDED
jgi:large subunit ribosomal protein L22